ncbi:MAG: cupin domain-containing protein [Roseobacter sp.]|nr:cupin domain-containing protein [Roseobacter sp.]
MISYRPESDVGPLEDWPFENPASAYVIKSGTPRASGRLDAGGPGHKTRFGIWRCTVGVFECIEQGDELMTVLSGRCRLTNHTDGTEFDLSPHDSLFIRDGSHVTWDIAEDITKVFHGFKPDGY